MIIIMIINEFLMYQCINIYWPTDIQHQGYHICQFGKNINFS